MLRLRGYKAGIESTNNALGRVTIPVTNTILNKSSQRNNAVHTERCHMHISLRTAHVRILRP